MNTLVVDFQRRVVQGHCLFQFQQIPFLHFSLYQLSLSISFTHRFALLTRHAMIGITYWLVVFTWNRFAFRLGFSFYFVTVAVVLLLMPSLLVYGTSSNKRNREGEKQSHMDHTVFMY